MVDFDFFGYQITAHLVGSSTTVDSTPVDAHDIPVPHFGLIMSWEDWHRAVDHMSYIGVSFRIAPHIRFKEAPGEQATFFLEDPSGNCLEFKAFRNPEAVFQQLEGPAAIFAHCGVARRLFGLCFAALLAP